MVEILQQQVEKFEDVKVIKKKSAAQTYRGWLWGRMQICRNEANKTMEIVYQEMLNKFNEMFPERIIKIVLIEGWKRHNGEFPIYKDIDNDYVIEIWHNEAKEVKKVPKEHMQAMLEVIRHLRVGQPYKCYTIAKLMGMDWKDVWKERTNIYFPYYYFPLKIYNELGVVKYGSGKNTIMRLR